jgi:hypothetical protein
MKHVKTFQGFLKKLVLAENGNSMNNDGYDTLEDSELDVDDVNGEEE